MLKMPLSKRLDVAREGVLTDPSCAASIMEDFENTKLWNLFTDDQVINSYILEDDFDHQGQILTYKDAVEYIAVHWPKSESPNDSFYNYHPAAICLKELADFLFVDTADKRVKSLNKNHRKYKSHPLYAMPINHYYQAAAFRSSKPANIDHLMTLYYDRIQNFKDINSEISNFSDNLLRYQPNSNTRVPDITSTIYTFAYACQEHVISRINYLQYLCALLVSPFTEFL